MNNRVKFNIFFAAKPIHLLCVYELHRKNPDIKFQLIIFLQKNDYANDQLYQTLNFLGFEKYISVQLYPKNKILNYFSYILLAAKLYKSFKYLNVNIIMTDFRNSFEHLLRCVFRDASFTLIDDGFYTYLAYQKYIKNNIYLPINNYKGIRGFFSRWIYFGTNYHYLKNKKIELFSIYLEDFNANFNPNHRNTFLSIKDRIGKNFPPHNNDNVFFIGTNNSECGAMTLKNELFYIKWLNNYWKKKGKKLFYIAKRSSSDKKLLLIKNLNIKVLQFNLPLELALIKNDFIPGSICALGPTLLKTLPLFYKHIEYFIIDVTSLYHFQDEKVEFKYIKSFCSKYTMKTIVIKR